MAPTASTQEEKDFNKTIKDELMIHLYFGGDEPPDPPTFCIAANMWRILSDRFAMEIEVANEHEHDPKFIDIECDEGDKESWEVLLYWAYTRKLHTRITTASEPLPLINAWLLGEYYEYPEFQDLIMLELLRLDSKMEYGSLEIKAGFRDFIHDCGDQMRQFMAEAAVREIEVRKTMRSDDMEDLEGVWGKEYLMREMLKAYHCFNKHGEKVFDRFGEVEGSKVRWTEFRIEDGPKEHWVHEKAGEGRERKRRRGN